MKRRLKKVFIRLRFFGKKLFERVGSEKIKINILQAFPFWVASLLTGLIAVGYSKLFFIAEASLSKILHWHLWLIFIVAPVSFGLACLTVQLMAPNAKGSGIPQVMAAIELSGPVHERSVNRLLNLKIIIVKIISSILMIFGGGAVGREGPTIQIAGSVFRLVNKWIPASWPKLSRQSFVLTGAAAGLAAAFNTPLGGVVFAMEELARIHIRFFRTALFTAVIIAGLTAQGLLGPYLYLGYPDVKNVGFNILATVALTALISGMLGALMSVIILKIIRLFKNLNFWKSIFVAIAAGFITAAFTYFINPEIIGSGKDLMNSLLFTDNKSAEIHTVIARIAGPAISFNAGGAGGIFAPSLAAGATVGAYLSMLFHYVAANANILILSGMVGFLTGVTRTPFTSAILVLEMTDRHSVIFHLLLAAMISNLAALFIDKHSLYERLKKNYIKKN
jgi:H+/Cl- antiporter ClcA